MLHKTLALFCLLLLSLNSYSYKTLSVKAENEQYQMEINYPDAFVEEGMDEVIAAQIDQIKADFIQGLSDQTGLPETVPGKNTLSVTYKITYQENQVLSLLISSSVFYRGAAHPFHQLYALNFMNGQPLNLSDLFKDKDYLLFLSSYARQNLPNVKKYDEAWLLKGSDPLEKNYRIWQFSEEGLVLVFNTYQIAPYVEGPQKLIVPLKELEPMLREPIRKSVWGSR